MNTPDRTFKLQGQLSTWSGLKTIAGRLAVSTVVVAAAGAILSGEAGRMGALASSLPIVMVGVLLRGQAKQKISEIETALSS